MEVESKEIDSKVKNTFTDEELDFLLDRLNKMEENIYYMNEDEKALREFLINYLNGLQDIDDESSNLNNMIKENFQDRRENDIEEADLECKKRKKSSLVSLLKDKVGELIIVNIISGKDCCEIKGVLCKIGKDMINLVCGKEIIFIRINAIVAIKNKLNEIDCNDNCDNDYCEDLTDDECIYEEEFFVKQGMKEKSGDVSNLKKESNSNDCQVNRREVNYIEVEEEE